MSFDLIFRSLLHEIAYLSEKGADLCFQIDRLQTDIQERDLTTSQQETLYRSDLADREEEISRLKADLNVLHEKVAQNEGQVSYEKAAWNE